MIDAEGFTTTFAYDQIGNMVTVTDGRGAAYRTEYTFDKLNREVKETIAPGSDDEAVTLRTYHPLGMLETMTDPMGLVATFTYDSLMHLSTRTMGGLTDMFVTDAAGNQLSQTDPRGEFYKREMEYDGVGRLKCVFGPSGTPDDPKPFEILYEYDDAGHLISESDPRNAAFKTIYGYDAAGRVTEVTDAAGFTSYYEYDGAGNQIEYRGGEAKVVATTRISPSRSLMD